MTVLSIEFSPSQVAVRNAIQRETGFADNDAGGGTQYTSDGGAPLRGETETAGRIFAKHSP